MARFVMSVGRLRFLPLGVAVIATIASLASGTPRAPRSSIASSTGGAKPSAPGAGVPACVRVWPEVRYRNFGYDHVVHIGNGCSRAADCSVTTDVNPQPTLSEVPAGAQVEVLTFRGSPARVFTPQVTCTVRPNAGER